MALRTKVRPKTLFDRSLSVSQSNPFNRSGPKLEMYLLSRGCNAQYVFSETYSDRRLTIVVVPRYAMQLFAVICGPCG